MRVLFLVVLILAGCVAPVKHGAKDTSVRPNAEPGRRESIDRSRNTSGPASEAMPQQQQAGKPELPLRGKGWIDISGKGRDDSALFQDSAACQVNYKQALAAAWQLYPEPLPGEDGTRNAQAVIIHQQNVRNYADTAYTECMGSKGWRKK